MFQKVIYVEKKPKKHIKYCTVCSIAPQMQLDYLPIFDVNAFEYF